MKIRVPHIDRESLIKAVVPPGTGDRPAVEFSVRFHERCCATGSPLTRLGMIDTGSDITLLPLDLLLKTATAACDQILISLDGAHGTTTVPAYRASVTIAGKTLPGNRCYWCAKALHGTPCGECVIRAPTTVFLVGGVEGLPFPLIGRDVLERFVVMMDFARTATTLSDHWFDGAVLERWSRVGCSGVYC